MPLSSLEDRQLVERHLAGDWTAFQQIVECHQAVVCAVALSACGDIGRSEDIAQEVFLVAWKKLPELREPEKLRSWLCGIARNLSHNALRQERREPSVRAEELSAELAGGQEDPRAQATTTDDFAVLWRVLETVPANYREPLILYYREHRSVRKVAEALDLSEELVRQRLSRGRELLNERMAKLLEKTLERSEPTPALSGAIIASVKGVAATAASATAPFALVSGPLAWTQHLSLKSALAHAQSPQERRGVVAYHFEMLGCLAVFYGTLVVFNTRWGRSFAFNRTRPGLTIGLLLGDVAAFIWCILAIRTRAEKRLLPLRRRAAARAEQRRQPADPVTWEYRSRLRLLGIPLIHIRFGGPKKAWPRCVVAWFAVGDISAIGLIFALSSLPVAPVSVGSISLGIWAAGGIALGWQAVGFFSAGWRAAAGAVAVAHDYAVGWRHAAIAGHANDAAALAYVKASPFLNCGQPFIRLAGNVPPVWKISLVVLLPSGLVLWRLSRKATLRSR